jgi:glycosyltransferase involved in cell wall biosynthesis
LQARILYVIGSLDVGGTEKQLYLLLKYIDRRKFSPFVVSLSEGGYWVDPIREMGIELKQLKNEKRYEMRRLFTLTNIIRKERPDIIHCYQPPGNRYGWLAGRLLGRQENTVVSRRSFNYGGESLDAFKKVADRFVYRGAGAVVCNSEALLGDLVGEYGSGIKTVVIPNGIEPITLPEKPDIEATKLHLGIPVGKKVVGTVGRLVPVKNHRLFLDVAREVLKAVPDAMFVVIGDGPMENDLRDCAKHHNISDRVLFTGFRSDVMTLVSAFDLFLLTSRSDNGKGEGFPNVVMEAMMCGVPCIVSDVGGTRELFKEDEAGYLVSPDDPETFVRRSVELLNCAERRHEMGLRGVSIVKERYLAPRMAIEFENLYVSILQS